jgi:Toprim-like
MSSSQWAHQRIGDFYVDAVLPALAARLDQAFPEFGWKQDARGWVASNEEMTHRVLGVRADRVVAHGAAPSGFLVHGGSSTLWTAYLNGGVVPRGEAFRDVVSELAARAGVDLASPERSSPRDRRTDLLHDFYGLCRDEFRGARGVAARSYLQGRGFPNAAIDEVDLGVVPNELNTKRALQTAGFSELEIAQSGVIADGRWPGRLCGAWRDERGQIGTFWTRSLGDYDSSTRYLYLRGASRADLPPYGISEVLRSPVPDRREMILLEGLMDVHQLRAQGIRNVASIGGARLQPTTIPGLSRLRLDSIVLAFDNDSAGREGLSQAVYDLTQADVGLGLRVLEPRLLGSSKDPDEFVRAQGVGRFVELVDRAECAVTWRAVELINSVRPQDATAIRRAALARAGTWLGALSPRLALEQEDAIRRVAVQCGYSSVAVERSFRARFWSEPPTARDHSRRRVIER